MDKPVVSKNFRQSLQSTRLGSVRVEKVGALAGYEAGTDPNGGEDTVVYDSCDYIDPGDPHDNPGAPLWDPPARFGDSGAIGDPHGGSDYGGGGSGDPGGGGGDYGGGGTDDYYGYC